MSSLKHFLCRCTVRKEMKCSRDSEILQGLVHDTIVHDLVHAFPIFVQYHELIRVVYQNRRNT